MILPEPGATRPPILATRLSVRPSAHTPLARLPAAGGAAAPAREGLGQALPPSCLSFPGPCNARAQPCFQGGAWRPRGWASAAGSRQEPAGGLLENKVFNKRAAPAPFTAQGRAEGTDCRAAGDNAVTATERGPEEEEVGRGGGSHPVAPPPQAASIQCLFQVHTTKGKAQGGSGESGGRRLRTPPGRSLRRKGGEKGLRGWGAGGGTRLAQGGSWPRGQGSMPTPNWAICTPPGWASPRGIAQRGGNGAWGGRERNPRAPRAHGKQGRDPPMHPGKGTSGSPGPRGAETDPRAPPGRDPMHPGE